MQGDFEHAEMIIGVFSRKLPVRNYLEFWDQDKMFALYVALR